MKKQIEELRKQNADLQARLLNSEIDLHFQKNGLNPGLARAVKVLAREQVAFDDSGNRAFKAKDRDYRSLDLWISSLPETEEISLDKVEAKSSSEAQKPRCKNDMSWEQKAQYKKKFGYAAYNALPLNSTK